MTNSKNRLSAAKVLGFAMIVAVCSLISGNVRAQCPDPSPIPPLTPAWSDAGCEHVQIAGTNCYATICVCSRTIGNETQFLIRSVQPDATTDCNALPPEQIIHGAIDTYRAIHRPHTDQIPPCPNAYLIQTYVIATCWMLPAVGETNPWGGVYGDGGYAPFVPCWNGTSWCVKTCQYCRNTTTVSITCTHSEQGSGNCTPLSQTYWWEIDKCYDLAP
jgi:hypothetical protein